MTAGSDQDLAEAIVAVIADTFSAPAAAISRATTADDIDGWDSLGHSLLLTRLARKLALPIGEDIASVDNVGELIDAIVSLASGAGRARA